MSLISFVTAFLLIGSSSAGWVLEDDYSTSNFFDMFSFWTSSDPTNGFVEYVSQSDAQSAGLISTASDGVYIGVDYTNTAPSGRQSVRITSNKSYNAGTLVILDLEHMPGGICATWPAFWTVGPNWPAGGEIDIIEGVHTQTTNDMTLHTADGCSIDNTGLFSGSILTDNCYIYAPGQSDNAGCQVDTSNTATYGSGFNNNGGGVYAMEWTTEAISIYFFQRGAIPSDITSGSPNPSGWGTPVAEFSGSCDIPSFFSDNQLVFDNTFCGDWAGATWSSSGCASTEYPTCESFVENNPSAFKNSYWQINSLQVFSETSEDSVASSAVATTTAEATSQAAATSTAEATSQAAVTSTAEATSEAASTSTTEATSVPTSTSTPAATTSSTTSISDDTFWITSSAEATSEPASTSTPAATTSSATSTSDDTFWITSSASSTAAAASSTSTSSSSTHTHRSHHYAQKVVEHYTPSADATSTSSSTSTSTTAAVEATTTSITEYADVVDGMVEENYETSVSTATGVARRSNQQPNRREDAITSKLSEEWRRRLESEKLSRMRAVRNVGSLHGKWRH